MLVLVIMIVSLVVMIFLVFLCLYLRQTDNEPIFLNDDSASQTL